MPTDPLTVLLSGGQATLALGLLFVLPGFSWGPILLPGAPTPLHVLGRAVGASLLIVSGLCILLAVVGSLRPAQLIATVVVVSSIPLVARRLRHDVRPVAVRGRRQRRWLAGAIGAVGVVTIVVVGPSLCAAGPDLLPATSTPWYYMAISREVAETGSIPATVTEWGRPRPFPTDYLPATVHAAAAIELLPGGLLEAAAWYRLGVLLAAVILAALLFRRWFSAWTAVLAACLLLATVRLEAKFLDLRPETFGLLLAIFTIWAADRAMADRSIRSTGMATIAATATFLSHAEVYLLLGPAMVGLAAARTVAGPSRFGLRLSRPMSLRASGVAAVVLVVSFVVGSGVNAFFAGKFRLVGYVAARQEALPIPAESLPVGWVLSGDPTWDFYVASVAPALDGQPPPTRFLGPMLLPRSILDVWPGLDGRGRGDRVTLALLLLAPVLIWPWLDTRRRRFILTWWVFGGTLLVGSWLLFTVSSTYVPARIGPRRLMPYELIVPVASAGVLLFTVDRFWRRGWRLLLPRRGAMVAARAALAVLVVAAAAPVASSGQAATTDESSLTPAGYEALRWIDANLSADARLLTNAYTDGSILAVARRASILDGRAVYLEDRPFLAESTRLALGARILFADPDGDAATRYVAAERVTHLLVATVGPDGNDLGGYALMATDLAALAGSGRYTQIRSFAGGRLLLFEVRSAG